MLCYTNPFILEIICNLLLKVYIHSTGSHVVMVVTQWVTLGQKY